MSNRSLFGVETAPCSFPVVDVRSTMFVAGCFSLKVDACSLFDVQAGPPSSVIGTGHVIGRGNLTEEGLVTPGRLSSKDVCQRVHKMGLGGHSSSSPEPVASATTAVAFSANSAFSLEFKTRASISASDKFPSRGSLTRCPDLTHEDSPQLLIFEPRLKSLRSLPRSSRKAVWISLAVDAVTPLAKRWTRRWFGGSTRQG